MRSRQPLLLAQEVGKVCAWRGNADNLPGIDRQADRTGGGGGMDAHIPAFAKARRSTTECVRIANRSSPRAVVDRCSRTLSSEAPSLMKSASSITTGAPE